jgi:hypothetical protein
MLLSKVKSSKSLHLWTEYSAWLVFCEIVLILTNGLASLTLIRDYRFSVIDVILTYGLIVFWGILEAAGVAALLVIVELLLEKILRIHLDLVFRVFLVAILVGTWAILLLTLLHVI